MCEEKLVSKGPLGCLSCQLPNLGRENLLWQEQTSTTPARSRCREKKKSMALAASLEPLSTWELHTPLQGNKNQVLILSTL